MGKDLGSIFVGSQGQAAETVATPAPSQVDAPVSTAPAASEPVKEGAGKDEGAPPAPTDTASAESTTDDNDPHPVPRKALTDERKKRQELEREVAGLRGQLSVYSQKPQPPQVDRQPIDKDSLFFEKGPAGYIDEALGATKFELAAQMSARELSKAHPDYAEAEAAFVEAAKQNPALAAQMNQAFSEGRMLPGEFAYAYGKQLLTVKKYGVNSVEELHAKIEADVRKKVTEELDAKYRKENALTAAAHASTSIAGANGTGPTSPVAWRPKPISSVFRGTGV